MVGHGRSVYNGSFGLGTRDAGRSGEVNGGGQKPCRRMSEDLEDQLGRESRFIGSICGENFEEGAVGISGSPGFLKRIRHWKWFFNAKVR